MSDTPLSEGFVERNRVCGETSRNVCVVEWWMGRGMFWDLLKTTNLSSLIKGPLDLEILELICFPSMVSSSREQA